MSSDFRVTIRAEGRATVVALRGELDLASLTELEHVIDNVLRSSAELVVLDVAELEFLDVAGLRSILRTDHRLRARGQRLALAAPGPGIRRLLALTGQEDALRVFGSTADALERG